MNRNFFEQKYDYNLLTKDIEGLACYDNIAKVTSIGQSYEGRDLYCIKIGNGSRKVLYVGCHHALEWGTSLILMALVNEYIKSLYCGRSIRGYDAKILFNLSTMYIIPMLNPDGVDLVQNGFKSRSPYHNQISEILGQNCNLSTWQANIRGVDLNHNYDALWQQGKEKEAQLGITGPSPTRYSGLYPESERESSALCKFTRILNPGAVIALHSQGEEIYYGFNGCIPNGTTRMLDCLTRLTGYKAAKPEGFSGYGGYKDWFIQEIGKPGFTIEAGLGKNPLTSRQIERAYNDLSEALIVFPMLL